MSFENGLFKGSNKTLATPRCMYRLLISFGRSCTWARRYRCSRACVLSVVLVVQIVVQIQAKTDCALESYKVRVSCEVLEGKVESRIQSPSLERGILRELREPDHKK